MFSPRYKSKKGILCTTMFQVGNTMSSTVYFIEIIE